MGGQHRPAKIVIQGANALSDVPGIAAVAERYRFECAPDSAALAEQLPGAGVLLGWNFRGRELADNWHRATDLRWIHWGGAGVDAALFPELADSDVILTNSRGLFDRPMAEFCLAYMLREIKLLPLLAKQQHEHMWKHHYTTTLTGQTAVIYGVGSIGREIARLLRAVGVNVCGVGRSARTGDADFGTIHGAAEKRLPLAEADWVIGILPGTAQTTDYFDAAFFAAMKPTARFINLGRGTAVLENDLIAALNDREIAGAMLDVFRREPLPSDSPLWDVPNLMISPHLSGDYAGYPADIAQLFFDNLERYAAGKPLNNVVDKKLGFVP
jgi:phosphoglycerate dehydrogenase-like enzyme